MVADINQSASLVQKWRTCLLEQQAVHDLAEKRCLVGWYSVLWHGGLVLQQMQLGR
jgi:hypothetical protein